VRQKAARAGVVRGDRDETHRSDRSGRRAARWGLRIVERGFSPVGIGGTVSLGAIVENTSTLVAYRTRVTLRVFDAQQQSVVPQSYGRFLRQEIPVILPGQRIGVGASTAVRDGSPGRPVAVASFEIDLGTPQWWPPDNDAHSFGPVTTSHQATKRDRVEPGSGSVTYTIESAYCAEIAARGVATVFRNGSGAVVGGDLAVDAPGGRCRPGRFAESSSAFRSIPTDVDDSRTESYPYCDPVTAGPQPTGSDPPVN
jgi:hypothetical protein